MNFPGSILVNRTKIRIVIIWAALAFFVVVSFQEMGWAQHVGQQGTEESVQEALLQEYLKEPLVQKLLNGDKKRLKAEVTAFKSCGAGSYQAVLELGFKMPDGSYKFSYFPFLLRIYRAVLHDGRIQFEDVTQVDLPETKLWAHYRVSTGSMGAAQNPDSLFSALVNGVQIHYVATDASKSDVFIPVEDSKLKLRFRTLLVNPSMGSIFWIHPDGKISLNQSTTEESDGPLSFGLMGGGKTGWSPWNHQFVGLVLGVEKGKLSQLENANSLLLPPHFGCAAK